MSSYHGECASLVLKATEMGTCRMLVLKIALADIRIMV